MKLSVVMPAYNEIETIEEIIGRVLAVDLEKELLIIDDGSTDGTREFLSKLSEPRIRVFFQEKNQGKGAAVRRGIAEANGDVVVIQDADLEYNPEEYHRLLEPSLSGQADVEVETSERQCDDKTEDRRPQEVAAARSQRFPAWLGRHPRGVSRYQEADKRHGDHHDRGHQGLLGRHVGL